MIINHRGELVSCIISHANTSDIDKTIIKSLTKNVRGKLFADRGYISSKLSSELAVKGISLITLIKKGMKNRIMHMRDRILLRYRIIIESSFNILKHRLEIEHTRHRSILGFMSNILSSLIAYTFYRNKPSIVSLNMRLGDAS